MLLLLIKKLFATLTAGRIYWLFAAAGVQIWIIIYTVVTGENKKENYCYYINSENFFCY